MKNELRLPGNLEGLTLFGKYSLRPMLESVSAFLVDRSRPNIT